MKSIRLSTAALSCVIALLVGALGVTIANTHKVPIFVDSAHAATYDQGPLTSFAPVVQRTMPAVVNISSSKVVKNRGAEQMPGMFDDPIFRQFFGNRMPRNAQPRSQREESLGSGVVVSPDGYIITNNHVVEGATDVKVSFSDKQEYPAKIVGTDPLFDLAVVKIDRKNLATIPLADSAKAQVGDVVLAEGEPFGLGGTVTMGIISAKGRAGLGIERFEDFIQTDAAINRGNSGGALINTHGELVGINTAILGGETGGNVGIGFAVPANLAKNVMNQIIEHGKAEHGFIGIGLDELTQDKAKAFGLPANEHGIAVTQVEPNTPAAKAGLQAGDVVTSFNGQKIEDMQSFRVAIAGMSPGARVNLGIVRNGSALDVPVTLGTMSADNIAGGEPDNQPNAPGGGEKGALKGVSVEALTPNLRQQFQIPEGTTGVVITDIDESSPAAAAGLQPGDIIQQVNHHKVATVDQFNAAVRSGNNSGSTLLLVKRGAGATFLVVPNK